MNFAIVIYADFENPRIYLRKTENFYIFAVGLKAKKPFRVQDLSNPTRIVIDFKNSEK